ncbi:diguanylate cyclase [Desulfosediminicola flagellatus]|uniref:diguanylate cyclase n=1 Tax=Desulfosediminicola flagellatus TaxID=2569541 RepID=UPI0010ABA003|nr:diguanylate cyclase [Desulfosediminicola flagellatus]
MKIQSVKEHEVNAQAKKQHFLTVLFSVTCIFFLSIFGTHSLYHNKVVLGSVCIGGAILNLVNFAFLRITGRYREACFIILLLMTVLTLYLICSGGSNNTGPLWFYVMPLLTFYVLELKFGIISMLGLLLMVALILLVPDNPFLQTQYASDFVTRFIASTISVSVLAFAFEYSRQDWVREITALNRTLEEMSRTDELTGLINRRDMKERLSEEVARFKQNKRAFSIVMGDIDHFKQINDTYGHDCGDVMLKSIAIEMELLTKEQDKVCRWGGEEFLLLLPETNLEEGVEVAERLRETLETLSIEYDTEILGVTMSFGVAEFNGSETLLDCLKRADGRLYHSKQNGRNQVTAINSE